MTYASQRIVQISKGKKTASVVITAYEKVWKSRGWRLDEPASKVTGTPKDTGNEVSTTEKKEEGK